MRAHQPFAEQMRRLCRCRAVKRHQGRRHSRPPHDVGAPAVVADRDSLDEVRAARDGFLKTMDVSGHDIGL